MDTSSIIVAVASPPGRSARGIVRASGPGAIAALAAVVVPVSAPARRGLHRAALRLSGGDLPCLAAFFPGPASYTGEDVVEALVPGNPALLDRIVERLIEAAGEAGATARRAEAGEFTARAFLSGRMDLTRAEGVAAAIAARSDAELAAARQLGTGRLAAFAADLADRIAGALALVEAGIDFTDQEDVVPIAAGDLRGRLDALARDLDRRLDGAVPAESLEAIPWVVLAGAPNAGKSTLFNALLGRERAVVSASAGTTRDAVAEPLTIETAHGPAEVLLVDVAGEERAPGDLPRAMQAAAREAIDRAELILRCIPVDARRTDAEPDARAGTTIVVRTKGDLAAPVTPSETVVEIHVSALDGTGLAALRRVIADRLADRAVSLAADVVVLRPRHEACLRDARDHLAAALELAEAGDGAIVAPELIAASMRAALDATAALSGEITPDDILGRVFAEFCVGK